MASEHFDKLPGIPACSHRFALSQLFSMLKFAFVHPSAGSSRNGGRIERRDRFREEQVSQSDYSANSGTRSGIAEGTPGRGKERGSTGKQAKRGSGRNSGWKSLVTRAGNSLSSSFPSSVASYLPAGSWSSRLFSCNRQSRPPASEYLLARLSYLPRRSFCT